VFSVTNPKVAGFSPRWSAFRGFTVLFDNPGASYTPEGSRLLLTTDPTLTFYSALRERLVALDLDLLTATYLFCPLPPSSLHVTACDGGNDATLGHLPNERRTMLAQFLDGLPDSLRPAEPTTALMAQSPLVTQPWPLRFRFDHLAIWSHSALVATLVPVDAASAEQLSAFLVARRALNAANRERHGFSANEVFVPHVTLGYFANREGAELAQARVSAWQEQFAVALAGESVQFESASLYGFTDLATFFKHAQRVAPR
jgi:hypothetical protein